MLTRRALLGVMLGLILECLPLDAQTAGIFGPPVNQYNVGRALWPLDAEESAAGITWAQIKPYYYYGDARRYGMNGDGATDNVAAFNLALAASYGRRLYIPAGTYRFASKPNDITSSLRIEGDIHDQCILLADYNEGTGTTGFLQFTFGGFTLDHLRIHKNTAKTGGTGIVVKSSASVAASFISIDDVIVTGLSGTGTWNFAIYVDGTLKTGAPIGVRDLKITNSHFFAATTELADFLGVEGAKIDAGFFLAGGTSDVVRISGTAAVPSNNVIVNAYFTTNATIDRVNNLVFGAPSQYNINDTANATNVTFIASQYGTDTRVRTNPINVGDLQSGATTVTLSTGCTTTPTTTLAWKFTNHVFVGQLWGDLSCTSNATTAAITGLPAQAQPVHTQTILTTCADNGGARAMCNCTITGGTTTINCNKDIQNAAWTAAGTKVIINTHFAYPTD